MMMGWAVVTQAFSIPILFSAFLVSTTKTKGMNKSNCPGLTIFYEMFPNNKYMNIFKYKIHFSYIIVVLIGKHIQKYEIFRQHFVMN